MRRFQNIAARAALALVVTAIIIALAAGFGTRLGIWNVARGQFGIFPYAIGCAVVAFAAAVLWAAVAFLSGSGAGARYGVPAMIVTAVLFWVPLREFWLTEIVHAVPPVHDISTDTEHAPEFLKRDGIPPGDAPLRYNGLRKIAFEGHNYAEETLQKLYYGDIKPSWQLGTTSGKLFQRALAAARDLGWSIVAVAPDEKGGRIQASDSTLLFGLTDDIMIRVQPAGIGTRLDVRSRSRESLPDFGRNAARIRAYLKRIASS